MWSATVLSVHIHCREKSFAFQEPVSSDDGTAAGLVTDRASRFVKHHLTETLVVLQQHFTVLGLEHVQALKVTVPFSLPDRASGIAPTAKIPVKC